MKTKTSVLSGLSSCLARAGSRFAAIAAVLVASAGSLSATQVAWISGGPNADTSSGAGYVDGDLTAQAEYNTPSGIAIDISGDNLVVADKNNNAVRVLVFSQNTTYTLLTYTNNVQANNLFTQPIGVALDPEYNLFVLCRGTGKNGYVMEFDYMGNLIATNMANIANAGGIALDGNDNIFVTASNSVFEVSSLTGAVTNLATITAANSSLQGIVVKHNGLLAVCDTGRNGILLINPGSGVVTTNAGFHGQGDFVSAQNIAYSNTATFYQPSGITESGDGTLIVTDYGNGRVKAVLANGEVTNVYGISSKYWSPAASGYPGFQDGTVALPDNYGGVAGREEYGVVVAPDGSLYVSEDYYHIIRHVTGAGFVPEPVPPNPPQSLIATVVTNSGLVGVELQWSGSQGATNYLVERSPSTNSFTIIGQSTGNNFLDTNVIAGYTYYYVVQAEGSGGISGISPIAGVTIPIPPPPAPNIGWYDFEGSVQFGFFAVMHPISPGNPYIAHNPLDLAIDPTVYNGVSTYYITSPPGPTNASASYVVSNGSTPPEYINGQIIGSVDVNPLPPLSLSNGVVTVEAVNVNGANEDSAVASASVKYEIGNPTISSPNGGSLNAAQFTVSDVSTNVIFYYTLDGSDPTNAPTSQQVYSTNGVINLSLNGSTNIFFEVRAIGYGPEADYLMSGIASYVFTPGTFVPNEISWGFASGEGSSEFIGAAGQNFVAPVTLTMLPGVSLFSLQFNMTVSTSGPGVTNPAPINGPFSFQSMLMQPIPNTQPQIYTNIPPLVLAAEYAGPGLEDTNYVIYNGEPFVNLTVSNGNELAVGWAERAGFTNLYNTKAQTLITYSIAHDTLYPSTAQGQPNGVFAGGYMFQLSSNAVNGQQYQIELSRASGTSDGVGAPGSGVDIYAADLTNSASLAPGTLSGIKNVTVGSIPYLVGNVYPFRWFNAGDFGNSNLQSADIEQVLQSAIYDLNVPPVNPLSTNASGGYTIVCDMYDAEDSCGHLGYLDNNPADNNYGYYTNAGPLTLANEQQLFDGNYSLVNNMAFGDGKLDISDIYLTFLRSEFTNDFVWFQRMWTNGVRVASPIWAPGVIPPGTGGGGVGGGQPAVTLSITNTPIVNFTSTDFVASAGQTLSIPISASVFGPYPMRMLMLNMSVVPLDGSPALTSAINFTPSASMNTAFGSATPYYVNSSGNGNYSAAWLPLTPNVIQLPGYANTANLGTLTVTIPTNATSMSAYAVHFDTASGSPSGLLSFPSRTLTGLITLCSRTNSSYSDGIPDSWRLRYFGTIDNELSVSNADADGTGMNNWQKYCAGLNPVDCSSVLNEGSDRAMAQSAQDMVLYWPSVSGKVYTIKRSSSLFPPQWTTISTNVGNGTYMEIHDSAGGPSRYYEVTTP